MLQRLIAITILCGACGKDHSNSEQAYVANEVVELKAALAARDETKVLVGCMSVTASAARMPKPTADEIALLCSTDAPRLLLENAVKEATDAKAKHPELGDLNCMQLLASDAFKMIGSQPPKDPALQKLVDDYTRSCPEQVAKFRARPQ
jgi:hypothetical protein